MKAFWIALPIVAGLALVNVPTEASARQFTTPSGKVAHTRRLPVILHRAVPPQLGKHIYVGRR